MADQEDVVMQEEATPLGEVEKPVKKSTKKEDDFSSDVQVKALFYLADRRREFTIIADVSDESKVWLYPTQDIPGKDAFTLTKTELAKLPRPYDFKAEVKELLPSVQEIVRSLWQHGIITKDDLTRVPDVRNALGVLPSANAFVQFAKGEH
jgi:hypothetical protein